MSPAGISLDTIADSATAALVDGADATAVVAKILAADRVLIASHENPDGDALGSVSAMQMALEQLGKDVACYVPGGEVPVEYAQTAPIGLSGELPADVGERLLIALDCGNASRLAHADLPHTAAGCVNIDHHGDNPLYGDENLVRPTAACTTQLVFGLLPHLGVELTTPMARAIYVGLVTDTGRFQYSNTTAAALEMAAHLVAAGVDPQDVYVETYGHVPAARLLLHGRAFNALRIEADGLLAVTHLTQRDFAETGADADDAEGIVDALRSCSGTELALFLRDLDDSVPPRMKGSLRTMQRNLDVSAIARTWSGGGHRQAAGFTTTESVDEVVNQVVEQLHAQRK